MSTCHTMPLSLKESFQCLTSILWYKKKIKQNNNKKQKRQRQQNRKWLNVVCTLIDNDIRHQNVVDSRRDRRLYISYTMQTKSQAHSPRRFSGVTTPLTHQTTLCLPMIYSDWVWPPSHQFPVFSPILSFFLSSINPIFLF